MVLGEILSMLIYQRFMPNNNKDEGYWKLGGAREGFYASSSVCRDCSYLITCYILYAVSYLEKKVTSKHNQKNISRENVTLDFIWIISKKKKVFLPHFKRNSFIKMSAHFAKISTCHVT